MSRQVPYQRRVAGACVEISEQRSQLASIVYPYPDATFEHGGMDVVLSITGALVSMLRELSEHDAFFLSGMGFHCDEEHADKIEALARLFEEKTLGLRTAEIGAFEPIAGVWMSAEEGLTLLRELGPRFSLVIAEEAEARFLLLDKRNGEGSGWDIVHSGGITTIGRWDGNAAEGMPGPLQPSDLGPIERVLDRMATEVLPAVLRGRIEA